MNARFTAYINGDYVRLTLKPGQTLNHHEGGLTDEGYSHTHTSWSYDGLHVTRDSHNDSSDCDGRLTSSHEQSCPVGLLRAHRADYGFWSDTGECWSKGPPMPEWQHEGSDRRDYRAEAMGY
jgi:hypothetical protein